MVHRVIVQCLCSDLDDDGGIDPVGERVPTTRSVWGLCWVFFGHANSCFLLASLMWCGNNTPGSLGWSHILSHLTLDSCPVGQARDSELRKIGTKEVKGDEVTCLPRTTQDIEETARTQLHFSEHVTTKFSFLVSPVSLLPWSMQHPSSLAVLHWSPIFLSFPNVSII